MAWKHLPSNNIYFGFFIEHLSDFGWFGWFQQGLNSVFFTFLKVGSSMLTWTWADDDIYVTPTKADPAVPRVWKV